VQTAALLEVAHVALGLVRSGLGTTSAQVASRLVLVWGVLAQFPVSAIRESPIFSTMVLAWSVAELVRYATYALALLNTRWTPLEWLRYSLFYALYPLGAGSEAYLMYASIPYARAKFGRNGAVALVILVLVWPPGAFLSLILIPGMCI
jgi:very-long-chain (3R)-3-hydroxyacyl-CoA dehydratase